MEYEGGKSLRKLSVIILTTLLVLSSIFIIHPSTEAAKGVDQEPRNLVQGLPYEWSDEPEPQYADTEYKLTDGVYGSEQFWDDPWIGHLRGKTREVIFDLGEKKSIERIQANFLQDSASGIQFPNTVSIYVSNNKHTWGTLAHINTKIGIWTSGPPVTQQFVWDGKEDGFWKGNPNATMAYARYVKVTFTTEVWTFIDEIEIWGYDGKMKGAVPVSADPPRYLQPGIATGGIKNLVLLYNGHYDNGAGNWTKEEMLPYVSYVDEHGEPQDWMFDGVLLLGLLTPQGRNFGTGQTTLSDWEWYLDKTFGPEGELYQLNEAVGEAKAKLNDPNYKEKVVIMIPYPGNTLTDFGDVDGDGISENFNSSIIGEEAAHQNKLKAIYWWMDEVKNRWKEGNYQHLQLTGMYWLSEGVGLSDSLEPQLIQKTSELVHRNYLKFFWIPYFQGNRNYDWKYLGFDAAVLQPNHFFSSINNEERILDASMLAQKYHMGIEIEVDERMNRDPEKRERYIDYLHGGVYYGYMKHAFKAYYQGNKSLLESALSDDPNVREHYDWMHQFVKGTYKKE